MQTITDHTPSIDSTVKPDNRLLNIENPSEQLALDNVTKAWENSSHEAPIAPEDFLDGIASFAYLQGWGSDIVKALETVVDMARGASVKELKATTALGELIKEYGWAHVANGFVNLAAHEDTPEGYETAIVENDLQSFIKLVAKRENIDHEIAWVVLEDDLSLAQRSQPESENPLDTALARVTHIETAQQATSFALEIWHLSGLKQDRFLDAIAQHIEDNEWSDEAIQALPSAIQKTKLIHPKERAARKAAQELIDRHGIAHAANAMQWAVARSDYKRYLDSGLWMVAEFAADTDGIAEEIIDIRSTREHEAIEGLKRLSAHLQK